MLDSIGIKVLQLYLVVLQQPPNELVGGGGESLLVEVSEVHDVAIGQRRHVLLTGQQPPLDRGLRTEKTTVDKALQALDGDVRAAPQIH